MKERNGFVSNSSSSSFIVHGTKRTTSQIMRDMLKLVRAEWKEEKHSTRAITKTIKWLQSHPKKDIPLLFPNTCNYETWIFKNSAGTDTIIETCNNHDWESMDFDYVSPEGDDEDWKYMKTLKFLDLADMKEKTHDELNEELYPELSPKKAKK